MKPPFWFWSILKSSRKRICAISKRPNQIPARPSPGTPWMGGGGGFGAATCAGSTSPVRSSLKGTRAPPLAEGAVEFPAVFGEFSDKLRSPRYTLH